MRDVPVWVRVIALVLGMGGPVVAGAYFVLGGLFVTDSEARIEHKDLYLKIEGHTMQPAHPVSAAQQKATHDQVDKIMKNQQTMNDNLIKLGERFKLQKRMERFEE